MTGKTCLLLLALYEIAAEVSAFLADQRHQTDRAQLESRFRSRERIAPPLEKLVSGSPRMASALPRVQHLSKIGGIGLAALDCIGGGQPESAEWRQNALALLTEASSVPTGGLQFTFQRVPLKGWAISVAATPLRQLVLACQVPDTHP